MTGPLRRAHRAVMIALAVILPIAILVAFAHRNVAPISPAPEALKALR
jgi:hypothetical protein